jgi:hypothetical protein
MTTLHSWSLGSSLFALRRACDAVSRLPFRAIRVGSNLLLGCLVDGVDSYYHSLPRLLSTGVSQMLVAALERQTRSYQRPVSETARIKEECLRGRLSRRDNNALPCKNYWFSG